MLAASGKGFARATLLRPLASLITAAGCRSSALQHIPAPRQLPLPAAAAVSGRRSVAAAARGTMASTAGLAPRAKAVLDYWFGEGWEAADPNDRRAEKFKIWFMGGPQASGMGWAKEDSGAL